MADYNTPNSEYWRFNGADYTIHLCDLIRNGFDMGWDLFPIWDEAYRKPLTDMIEKYFWTWEIGYETEYQFKLAMISDMMRIMPKYNIMFKARGLTSDPLLDHDMHKTHGEVGTKDTINDIESDREINKHNVIRQSDTPQQNLNNLGFGTDEAFINQWLSFGEIDDEETKEHYKEHAVEDTDTSRAYAEHEAGRKASMQQLAKELFETAWDIESMIIEDLKHNFMGLFSD